MLTFPNEKKVLFKDYDNFSNNLKVSETHYIGEWVGKLNSGFNRL